MTKKRLGELLVDEGLITEEQVQEVLAEQKKTKGLFGEILVSKSYVTELDIARTIARQFSIPFISAMGYDIPLEVVELFSFDMLEKYQFVPIDRFGDVLTVVIAGVMDGRVLEEIEKASGCTVQVYAGTASDVKATLKKLSAEISKQDPKKKKTAAAKKKTTSKEEPEKPAEPEPEPEEPAPQKPKETEKKPAEKKLSMNEILKQALRKQAMLDQEPEQENSESPESEDDAETSSE
jgi:flagellar biosynthesis GTPase FlhF